MALWQSEKFTTENLFGFLWNNDNELGDYYLPLETNILPKIGSIVPTFTRDTIGTVVDFEGVVHECQIDDARFQGARRVENLITNSEDMTAGGWTIEQTATITPTTFTALEQSAASKQNINTEEGVSYILSFTAYVAEGARGTGFYFRHFNSPTGARTEIPLITSTPTRYEVEILGRIGGGNCLVGIYDSNSSDWVTLNITDFQFEKVPDSQTEASEYVSDGVSVQLGSEIVSNGTFDDDSNWVISGEAEINSGSGRLYSSTGDLSIIGQNLSLVEGKSYLLEFDIIGTPSGAMKIGSVYGGTDIIGFLSGTGSYSFLFESTGNYISFTRTSGACDIRIDNVSVKEEYYHGAGVDGVKYFNTDRDGNLLTDIKGYLNEPESTNLCLYSEDIENWGTGSAVTYSNNEGIAPDGANTANLLVEMALDNVHFKSQACAVTSGEKYSFSVCLKKGAGITAPDIIQLTFSSGGFGSSQYANFNISTGEKLTVAGGSSTIEELYGGWYRLVFKATATSTTSTFAAVTFTNNNDSLGRVPVYLGQTTSDVYVWGIQVEEEAFPTSYIKTEATTVTRTADSLIIDNSNRDVLPNSFCLVGTWTPLGVGGDYGLSDIRCFGSQDSRGSNNEIRSVGFSAYSYTVAGSGGYYSLLVDDINQLIENKYAFQLFQDGSDVNVKIYKDGVEKLSETETQTLDHSNESLEIGSLAGTVFASMIKDVKIYNKELFDSNLKRITT